MNTQNNIGKKYDWDNKTRICPFCGKELPFCKDCNCPEATEKRLEWEREYEEDKRERERKIIYSRLKRAGVCKRYFDAEHEDANRLAEKVLEGTSIFISGSESTFLGCSVLRELALTANTRMKFLDVQTYFQLMFKQPIETVEDYGKTAVLMLDGLGNGYSNSMTVPLLFQLVNTRYNEAKPTIYASQYGFYDLFVRLGRNENDKSAVEALKLKMKENCVGWRMQTINNLSEREGA